MMVARAYRGHLYLNIQVLLVVLGLVARQYYVENVVSDGRKIEEQISD